MSAFLQLAHKYEADRYEVAGWYASEKLDGTRCFWDGGLTRDRATPAVPWANLDKSYKPVATGLWSRYGNVIAAPDWFLNQLPCFPLDGELYANSLEEGRSVLGEHEADPEAWKAVSYAVFDSPPLPSVFKTRRINDPNFQKNISFSDIEAWMKNSIDDSILAEYVSTPPEATFEETLVFLNENLESEGRIYLHHQTKLDLDEERARKQLDGLFRKVTSAGGEGLVVRHPHTCYEPKRSRNVLKYKPLDDAEGVLVGFTSGRKTGKGSKHLGKIGALILDYGGKRLELSGLNDAEREFATPAMTAFASEHPGVDMPADFLGKHFKLGQQITFTYCGRFTNKGLPKEARYFRVRAEE